MPNHPQFPPSQIGQLYTTPAQQTMSGPKFNQHNNPPTYYSPALQQTQRQPTPEPQKTISPRLRKGIPIIDPITGNDIPSDIKTNQPETSVSDSSSRTSTTVEALGQTDEVPGRKVIKAISSAPDPTFCHPCKEDDKKIPPEAFCPDCKEFLCSNCARVHRNMKITKSHTLQDKKNMPFSLVESEDMRLTEPCKSHAEEFIKYFCPRHEALLCGDCLAENEVHRSCKVEKISQVAKRYKEGLEYNSLVTDLVQMVDDIGELSLDIKANIKTTDEECIKDINDLRKFISEINKYIDKRERKLLEEIDETKKKSKALLNELKSKCKYMKTSSENILSELQSQGANNIQLFISGRKALIELTSLQTTMADVRNTMRDPRCRFRRDPSTEQLLASITAIGRMEKMESASMFEKQN